MASAGETRGNDDRPQHVVQKGNNPCLFAVLGEHDPDGVHDVVLAALVDLSRVSGLGDR